MEPLDRPDRLDRLDTLLALRLRGTGRETATLPAEPAEDDTLAAALAAADYLIGLRSVEPDESFARLLETRLIAYTQAPATPLRVTRAADHSAGRRQSPHAPRARRLLTAASLALVVGIATVTGVAAAAAQPGSLLYALHRFEQGMQVQLAPTAADRVQLHLANARAALAALNTAVTHGAGDPTYSDALATLQSEVQAAATSLATLPPGTARTSLAAQLQTLRQEAQSDLYAALPRVDWPDQLATTQALGSLGAVIPRVTGVTLQQLAPGGVRGWKVTISGSGFELGAEVVGSGGAVVGQVIASGPTQLIVDMSDSDRHLLDKGAGVRNPDGTAAGLAEIRPEKEGTGPQGTPDPGEGGDGSGHQPTPSPSVPRGS